MCTEQLIVISSESSHPSNGKSAELAAACCDGTALRTCEERERRGAAWMEQQETRAPEPEFGSAAGGM